MLRAHRAKLLNACSVAVAAACFSPLACAIDFQETPGLIEATDISDDGSTVVGTQYSLTPGFTVNAVRWRRGEELDILGDFTGGQHYSEGLGISGDGSVVVGRGEYDRYEVVIPPFGD